MRIFLAKWSELRLEMQIAFGNGAGKAAHDVKRGRDFKRAPRIARCSLYATGV